nr:PREDICTED: uncharacterized protein LOC103991341 [Musa acuminata subsp. malaccensis]
MRSVSSCGSRRGPVVASNHKKGKRERTAKQKRQVFCEVLNAVIRPLDVRQKATEKTRRAQSFWWWSGVEGGSDPSCDLVIALAGAAFSHAVIGESKSGSLAWLPSSWKGTESPKSCSRDTMLDTNAGHMFLQSI